MNVKTKLIFQINRERWTLQRMPNASQEKVQNKCICRKYSITLWTFKIHKLSQLLFSLESRFYKSLSTGKSTRTGKGNMFLKL